MHEYGLVCPKNTFVYKSGVCTGPKFAKCIACASGQYGPLRSVALTTGLNLMRPWHHRVDRFMAVSTAVARACASLGAPGRPAIQVIPPFLLDDSFPSADTGRPEFVPATGEYLMFAGALGPHKGLDVLLEAWAGLDAAIPLVLVGIRREDTPPHFPDGVTVVENVPNTEVIRAWANCTVAVVPSRWPEPFGRVALEAMGAGCPVVASAVGGLADLVVDGTTGILVPPGDAAALRAAIQQLLADPGRRKSMGNAGRRRAAEFTASVVIPQVEQVYDEVVGAFSSVPSP
jgi:glycosyltransferase involved in cell wall biosynthesis